MREGCFWGGLGSCAGGCAARRNRASACELVRRRRREVAWLWWATRRVCGDARGKMAHCPAVAGMS